MAKRDSNVVALPGAELPGLGIAATSGTGNRVEGTRNEIWLCPAYARNTHPLLLYVKLGLSTRAMLVEALCAQLAQCLGLDSPPPFLVAVQPHHVGREPGDKVLAFGAEDLSERSMARPLRNLETLLTLLRDQRVTDLATVFDEWIANEVRSPSDVLVSPEARLYLIDHEASLGEGMRPDQGISNWLAKRLTQTMTGAQERATFLRQLRARLAALHRVKLGTPPTAAALSPDGDRLYRELLGFLRDRLAHLDRLLSERVVPEQGYLWTNNDDPSKRADAAS